MGQQNRKTTQEGNRSKRTQKLSPPKPPNNTTLAPPISKTSRLNNPNPRKRFSSSFVVSVISLRFVFLHVTLSYYNLALWHGNYCSCNYCNLQFLPSYPTKSCTKFGTCRTSSGPIKPSTPPPMLRQYTPAYSYTYALLTSMLTSYSPSVNHTLTSSFTNPKSCH